MRCFVMFVTAVCLLFLLKLKWPKNKSLNGVHSFICSFILSFFLLREAFQYATKNTPFFNIQQNEEINKRCKVKEPVTQQHIKNARLVIKKTLRDQYLQNWLETQNRSPTNSREKLTHREIKNNYQFENYLTLITKPAHRISLTRLIPHSHQLNVFN